eukprot:TRINITY_DN61361_c0_g1_i1.p1 TRINITY_DN61361_c0_g1~~TRINITY_DN61361_c0_g1_i1.p1  ORF type:complete len:556 (-),score=47.08 TRINITY_DN61361_c0_g1_i1:127-1794(-)
MSTMSVAFVSVVLACLWSHRFIALGLELAPVSPDDAEMQAIHGYHAWASAQANSQSALLEWEDSFSSILTEQGKLVPKILAGKIPFPRIYVSASDRPLSEKHGCSINSGLRYGIEHRIRDLFLSSSDLLVRNPEDADYVFFPHCAMNAYFGLLGWYARQVDLRRLANETDASGFVRPILAELESTLLLPLADHIRGSSAFQACSQRLQRHGHRCRLLFVGFFGRHLVPAFAKRFPEAVFITSAAESSWIQNSLEGQALFWWQQKFLTFNRNGLLPPNPESRSPSWYYGPGLPEPISPHDIALPLPVFSQWTERSNEWGSRDLLAVFVGQLVSRERRALWRLFGEFGDDGKDGATNSSSRSKRYPGVRLHVNRRVPIEEFSALMHRSRLCLVPDGDQPNTERLVEAAVHGCVPIIITSRLQPPFNKLLAWEKCAIFVRSDEIKRLPELLMDLQSKPAFLEEMHKRTRALAAALLWGGPEKSAFHKALVVAELIRSSRSSSGAELTAGIKNEPSIARNHIDQGHLRVLPPQHPLHSSYGRVRRMRYPVGRAFWYPCK